jgi:hypothetical protein
MKRRSPLVSAALASAALTVGVAASAAPSTTYVATYGSDANSCSLALPCRSFSGAIVQTSDGGQIVVLDSGGYGPVQIDKSVSIIAPEGVYAGISVFTGVGVTITVPAEVRLVGLNIVGFGSLGEAGVHVAAGGPVSIERSTISGFGGGGNAIIYDNFPGSLRIVGSTLYSNSYGAVNTSVDILIDHSRFIDTAGSLGGMQAGITDSLFAFAGVAVFGIGGTGHGWIDRSVFTDASLVVQGSSSGSTAMSVARSNFVRRGIDVGTGINGGIALTVEASTFVDNAGSAIRLSSNDPSQRITLSNNVVVRNGGGATSFGLPIESRGNNTIRNNGTDGGPFVPVPGM